MWKNKNEINLYPIKIFIKSLIKFSIKNDQIN